MDLFETMRTMRAMRRLKPDPVPRELIENVVEAGICAPNGGGLQTWAFIAVDDASLKRQIATHVARWFDAMLARMGITPDIRHRPCWPPTTHKHAPAVPSITSLPRRGDLYERSSDHGDRPPQP